MTEIKNFFPIYYKENDDDLIINLSHLKEFSDLELEAEEPVPRIAGVPLKHQELQARYISIYTPYYHILLWHDMGTGKGCTISLIVERIKKSFVDGKKRKSALVCVRNQGLADSLKNEIARVCTRDIYLPKMKESEIRKIEEGGEFIFSDETQLRRMNAAIAESYEIVTFDFFRKLPNDTIIKRDYSNRLIIIDEVHNIREQPGKEDENTLYRNVHHFCHTVENCRTILATGTPIWDKVYDIAGVFNIILPLDNQFPTLNKFLKEYFDKDGVIIPKKAIEFSEKIRGKVSHVRAMVSSAKREEIGVKEPWLKHLTIYPSAMSEFQMQYSQEAKTKKHKKTKKTSETDKKSYAFLTEERDAEICVYPVFDNNGKVIGGTYGTEGFKNYAITKAIRYEGEGAKRHGIEYNQYKFVSQYYVKELGPAKGPDPYVNLRKYSSKLVAIIQMLLDPNRLNEKAFIFVESVTGTGGAISVAMILKLWGFSWIKSPDKIKRVEITTQNPGNLAVITSVDQTINEPAKIRKLFEVWNKDNNIYGNYVRVIIGSETIAQGHTMKAARQGHALGPHWNLSGTDQALARTFRTGSFDQLPKNERFLNIYRHAAVNGYYGEKDENENYVKLSPKVSSSVNGLFSTEETTDIHIYKIAENKAYLDSQIYRLMKQSSWDCALTYKRNVLVSDMDGSRECDFIECNYKCDNFIPDKTSGPDFYNKKQGKLWNYDLAPDTIDHSNYNLLYSKSDVNFYIKELIVLFSEFFVLRLDMIISLLSTKTNEINQVILLRALDKIINQRVLIKNRYGFGSYLKESKNTYFLENKVVPYSYYSASVYTIFPMVTEKSSLEDIVEIVQLQGDEGNVKKFVKQPTLLLFNKLSYRTKIILLEKVIELNHSNTKKSKKEKDIISLIETTMKREFFAMNDGNIVHNMYNSEYTGSGYNVMTQNLEPNGKIRVFDIEKGVWDNIDTTIEVPTEEKKKKSDKYKMISLEEDYINQIRKLSTGLVREGLEDNPYHLYGSSDIKTGKFKIHDDRKGKVRSGTVCEEAGMKNVDLYNIFYEIGHLPYDDEIADDIKNRNKDEIISIIETNPKFKSSKFLEKDLNEMSEEDLKRLYTIFSMRKKALCNSIERWFRGENKDSRNLFVQF